MYEAKATRAGLGRFPGKPYSTDHTRQENADHTTPNAHAKSDHRREAMVRHEDW